MRIIVFEISTIIKDSKKYIQKTQSAINRKYHFPFFPAKFSDQLHDNYCHNEERSFLLLVLHVG